MLSEWQHEASPTCPPPIPEHVDAAIAVGQEEHVVVIVPGDLVHLKLELLLRPRSVRFGVDEGHHIILVPHGDGLPVRTPAYINVFPCGPNSRQRSECWIVATQTTYINIV